MPGAGQPEHVSETALMVAAMRAMETARPDGIIRDPFAAQLAGTRGMALTREIPGLDWVTFGLSIRSRFVDELLQLALGNDVSRVIVLGAGLDARPWRLDLPPCLRWFEVDFAEILNYKAKQLASTPPKCRVERIEADLNDPACRKTVFQTAAETTGLMITEGLLMYLRPETVEALAAESPSGGVRYWILDVASKYLMTRASQDWKGVENLRPRDHLQGAQILDLARLHGWKDLASRTYTRDAWDVAPGRLRAIESATPLIDERNLPSGGDPSGVYLFGR